MDLFIILSIFFIGLSLIIIFTEELHQYIKHSEKTISSLILKTLFSCGIISLIFIFSLVIFTLTKYWIIL